MLCEHDRPAQVRLCALLHSLRVAQERGWGAGWRDCAPGSLASLRPKSTAGRELLVKSTVQST